MGDLIWRNVWVDGQMVGVRVYQADPEVLLHVDLLAAGVEGPAFKLDGQTLTIAAVNGTWRYRLRPGGERPHAMHCADLIEVREASR